MKKIDAATYGELFCENTNIAFNRIIMNRIIERRLDTKHDKRFNRNSSYRSIRLFFRSFSEIHPVYLFLYILKKYFTRISKAPDTNNNQLRLHRV